MSTEERTQMSTLGEPMGITPEHLRNAQGITPEYLRTITNETPAKVETPRTDKVCRGTGPMSHRQRRRLYLNHARQLETELAQAKAELNDAAVRYNEAIESEHAITVDYLNRAEKAEAELANALDQWNRLIGEHHKAGDAIIELRAELAECRKDRERLSHIITGRAVITWNGAQRVVSRMHYPVTRLEIDAAMKGADYA